MPHVSLPAQLKPQEFLPLPSGFGAGPGSLTWTPDATRSLTVSTSQIDKKETQRLLPAA